MQTGLVTKRASVPRNGRHERAMVGDVDEVQRHEAGRARELAVGAHAADVVRVGQRHRDHAGLPAARDRRAIASPATARP